jgi:hypothetical protein
MAEVPSTSLKPVTRLEAMRRLAAEAHASYLAHGPMVRIQDVASALGVTNQRVGDLLAEGRIVGAEIGGFRYVSVDAAVRYVVEGPRRPGRPRTKPPK